MAEQWLPNHMSRVRVPSVELGSNANTKESEVIVMLDPKIMRRFNKILKSVDKLSEEKQVRLCHFLEGYIIGQMTK